MPDSQTSKKQNYVLNNNNNTISVHKTATQIFSSITQLSTINLQQKEHKRVRTQKNAACTLLYIYIEKQNIETCATSCKKTLTTYNNIPYASPYLMVFFIITAYEPKNMEKLWRHSRLVTSQTPFPPFKMISHSLIFPSKGACRLKYPSCFPRKNHIFSVISGPHPLCPKKSGDP